MSSKDLLGADVASLERAIVDAVAPTAAEESRGWILAFDGGTVNRARSAAPLSHDACDPGVVAPIRDAYLARGLRPMFRVPETAAFSRIQAQLESSGLQAQQPTDVQVAVSAEVAQSAMTSRVRIDTRADSSWSAVFLGDGFDPVDGASRVRTLTRAPRSLFASIREEDGVTVAAGVLSLSNGWAGIHGMRTAIGRRREGLATQVLAALARVAAERGYARVALQVERANDAAQEVYSRCGFRKAWTYSYWREPG